MPKLMLVDGNSLVHRAYHAIPPLNNSKGEPTNAVFGFASMILGVLATEKPDHVVVAFDIGKTFRHEEAPSYKAQRPPMPEDLAVQFERVRRDRGRPGLRHGPEGGLRGRRRAGHPGGAGQRPRAPTASSSPATPTPCSSSGPTSASSPPRRRFSDTVIYDEDGGAPALRPGAEPAGRPARPARATPATTSPTSRASAR